MCLQKLIKPFNIRHNNLMTFNVPAKFNDYALQQAHYIGDFKLLNLFPCTLHNISIKALLSS